MKPFSWSWSKLKNYRTCPSRHYHVDLAKTFKENESEALKWGNRLHDAMAKCIKDSTPLPTDMRRFYGWPTKFETMRREGLKVGTEQKLAITRNFEPCNFFDAGAWFRCVVDVLVDVSEQKFAIAVDWKTGNKVNPEFEQLKLTAQTLFVHYPELTHVLTIYVWFGHDTQTVKVYTRDDMAELWTSIMPTVKMMDEAYRTTTYPAKPSGLCVNYCPVTSCPFHGKGSR